MNEVETGAEVVSLFTGKADPVIGFRLANLAYFLDCLVSKHNA